MIVCVSWLLNADTTLQVWINGRHSWGFISFSWRISLCVVDLLGFISDLLTMELLVADGISVDLAESLVLKSWSVQS